MFCNIDEIREKDGCKNYLRMILLFPPIFLYMKVLVEIIIFFVILNTFHILFEIYLSGKCISKMKYREKEMQSS